MNDKTQVFGDRRAQRAEDPTCGGHTIWLAQLDAE